MSKDNEVLKEGYKWRNFLFGKAMGIVSYFKTRGPWICKWLKLLFYPQLLLGCPLIMLIGTKSTVYAIYFAGFLFSRISWVGCYSRIYQHAKIFTSDPDAWMRKYLPPIPTHECDLCTQYIALLDREFNHSRKCLKVPIREKLDSRNIWRIQ